MKDYLAIIRKLDFVDLFKYGHFTISYAVPFDGNVSEHANDEELFDALTSRMNMYEYSFEYLIVHFIGGEYEGEYISIDIRNVCGVYTFDMEAKKEMSISFDSRIQLYVSPWAEKFKKLQQKLSIKQCMRGVDNLWTIFGLPEEDRIKCEEIVTPEAVREVFRELYLYERPFGDLPIWTYLLRYERHSFYPKDMIGFFCDFIHVYCNYTKKQELNGEIAESTQLYPQLIACKKPQFQDLYQIVESSALSQLTEQASGCRFSIAAPLFLYLKSHFSDGLQHKPDEKFISYSKKIGGFEFSIAVYLLGIALGYDKTYDAFYETAELQFFKKKSVTEAPSEKKGGLEDAASTFPQTNETNAGIKNESSADTQESTIGKESNSTQLSVQDDKPKNPPVCVQEDLFGGEYDSDEDHKSPIMWMKKKTKGKGKVDVRPVFNDEEQYKLSEQGYEPIDRFTANIKETIASWGYNPEIEKMRKTKNKKK